MDSAHIIHMANQIAKNLAAQGDEAAATATANHIRDYWEPRMITALIHANPTALSPIARAARATFTNNQPAPQ
ncbi:MAG: formate dehydrogenase subunit delta [Sphingopyxis sp.]